MEAYRTRGRSEKGKLVIGIPKEFDEKILEVIIINDENREVLNVTDSKDERKERLMKIIGSAKHPDFPVNKYDVYDQ